MSTHSGRIWRRTSRRGFRCCSRVLFRKPKPSRSLAILKASFDLRLSFLRFQIQYHLIVLWVCPGYLCMRRWTCSSSWTNECGTPSIAFRPWTFAIASCSVRSRFGRVWRCMDHNFTAICSCCFEDIHGFSWNGNGWTSKWFTSCSGWLVHARTPCSSGSWTHRAPSLQRSAICSLSAQLLIMVQPFLHRFFNLLSLFTKIPFSRRWNYYHLSELLEDERIVIEISITCVRLVPVRVFLAHSKYPFVQIGYELTWTTSYSVIQ